MWLSTSCYYGIKQYKILHHVLLHYALVYSYVNQSLRHNTGTMMTRLEVEDKRQQQEVMEVCFSNLVCIIGFRWITYTRVNNRNILRPRLFG